MRTTALYPQVIANAIASANVTLALIGEAAMPADGELPAELRWVTNRNAYCLRVTSLASDIESLVEAIPLLAMTPRRSARVPWVDDRPANNEFERKLLRVHGIVFDNVVSTGEALEQLANESYDLVITDLGRRHLSDRSATAGAVFIELPELRDVGHR